MHHPQSDQSPSCEHGRPGLRVGLTNLVFDPALLSRQQLGHLLTGPAILSRRGSTADVLRRSRRRRVECGTPALEESLPRPRRRWETIFNGRGRSTAIGGPAPARQRAGRRGGVKELEPVARQTIANRRRRDFELATTFFGSAAIRPLRVCVMSRARELSSSATEGQANPSYPRPRCYSRSKLSSASEPRCFASSAAAKTASLDSDCVDEVLEGG